MLLDKMRSESDILANMTSDAELVSFEIRLWLNKFVDSQIKDAAMFSCLETSGKKIRPILFLEVLRLFNMDAEKFLSIAAAIEMCHVYSLVHDDLPSLDNDDFIVSDVISICVVPVEMPNFEPKLNVLFPVHTLLPPKETDDAEFAFTNAVVATLVELSDET